MGYRYLKLRTPNLGFDETTAPGYYEPLRTLNVELLLIVPYGGLTFVRHAPFLTGSSVGSTLTPSANARQTQSSAAATSCRVSDTYTPKSSLA